MIRLVTFQDAIFSTIQGEGNLVGTLATFVRLHGCDYSCAWCDTKDSWREGSTFVSIHPIQVSHLIKTHRNRHVVITGGNPVLQGDGLATVLDHLDDEYHVTIETQGSVYHPILERVNLISLSPKLHAWNWDLIRQCVKRAETPGKDKSIQFKVVVQTETEVMDAIPRLEMLHATALRSGYQPENIYCYLQPESSRGRKWTAEIHELISQKHPRLEQLDFLRVLPQVHKFMAVI